MQIPAVAWGNAIRSADRLADRCEDDLPRAARGPPCPPMPLTTCVARLPRPRERRCRRRPPGTRARRAGARRSRTRPALATTGGSSRLDVIVERQIELRASHRHEPVVVELELRARSSVTSSVASRRSLPTSGSRGDARPDPSHRSPARRATESPIGPRSCTVVSRPGRRIDSAAIRHTATNCTRSPALSRNGSARARIEQLRGLSGRSAPAAGRLAG